MLERRNRSDVPSDHGDVLRDRRNSRFDIELTPERRSIIENEVEVSEGGGVLLARDGVDRRSVGGDIRRELGRERLPFFEEMCLLKYVHHTFSHDAVGVIIQLSIRGSLTIRGSGFDMGNLSSVESMR